MLCFASVLLYLLYRFHQPVTVTMFSFQTKNCELKKNIYFIDTQWENLIHQKSEAVKLVEEEYVTKYKTLEEQFYTQQKSHENREIELLKTIDSLKNEVTSKDSTIDDLQSNMDTLEGGIQVLNQEIAQQGEQLVKIRRDSDYKIR